MTTEQKPKRTHVRPDGVAEIHLEEYPEPFKIACRAARRKLSKEADHADATERTATA